MLFKLCKYLRQNKCTSYERVPYLWEEVQGLLYVRKDDSVPFLSASNQHAMHASVAVQNYALLV